MKDPKLHGENQIVYTKHESLVNKITIIKIKDITLEGTAGVTKMQSIFSRTCLKYSL